MKNESRGVTPVPGQDPAGFHPRSSSITFKLQGSYSCFRINGEVHAGLTKILKECFYPDYKYIAPPRARQVVVRGGGGGSRGRFPFRNAQQAGMSRGKRLDLFLTKMLDFLEEFELPHKVFNFRPINTSKQTKEEILEQYCTWVLTCNDKITKKKTAGSRLRSIINSKNKHIFLLWKQWSDQGYQLIATQLSVGVFRVCATNIDCLLRDAFNRYYVVEIKTGMDQYWDVSTGPMKAPFEHLTNSPRNQALLQVAFGWLFYQYTYPSLKDRLHTPIVYRVTPKAVEQQYLPESIQNKMTQALHALIHRPPSI